MNTAQFMAWVVCLAIAFFAAALAVHSGYRVAVLQKRIDRVMPAVACSAALAELGAALHEVRTELNATPAPDAARLEELRSTLEALKERLEAIDRQLASEPAPATN